ncbi:MAG: formate dehydrogenase accessory protein FdhE [Syntrophomonadaceae bacterium]|nr:formate dehydrogenase accessory protein FdhE [Syntrophomonadaceae bacterium]
MTNRGIEAPEDLIGFYEDLTRLQDELVQTVPRGEICISEEKMQDFSQNQLFWLQLLPFPLDAERFLSDLKQISDFVIRNRPQSQPEIAAIVKSIEAVAVSELAQRALWLDHLYFAEMAEERRLSPGLLVFLAENAIRPQLRAWTEGLVRYVSEEIWRQPHCPICGQAAIISRLRPGDGQRVMFCGHCFSEWTFRHMMCPHCGNSDHESISIISVEDDRFNLIYGCNRCKGYLKTLNERQGGKAGHLFVEGARTFYLDLLAAREGYQNPELKRASLN